MIVVYVIDNFACSVLLLALVEVVSMFLAVVFRLICVLSCCSSAFSLLLTEPCWSTAISSCGTGLYPISSSVLTAFSLSAITTLIMAMDFCTFISLSGAGIGIWRRFASCFKVCSIFISFSNTYHNLCKSELHFCRRSLACHLLPVRNAKVY